MKNIFFLIFLICIVILSALGFTIYKLYYEIDDIYSSETIQGVIVNIRGTALSIYSNLQGISIVRVSKSDINKYAEGQEVLIYYDTAYMAETEYSARELYDIKKIQILSENSRIEIPDYILTRYYDFP